MYKQFHDDKKSNVKEKEDIVKWLRRTSWKLCKSWVREELKKKWKTIDKIETLKEFDLRMPQKEIWEKKDNK